MKNCVILEIRECSEQACFAVLDTRYGEEGEAKLLTAEEASLELAGLRRKWPDYKFQVVMLDV